MKEKFIKNSIILIIGGALTKILGIVIRMVMAMEMVITKRMSQKKLLNIKMFHMQILLNHGVRLHVIIGLVPQTIFVL